MLYSLDEQVRRYEVLGKVEKFETHEFMRLVLDEQGVTRGVVIMDLFNLRLEILKADAVVIATGGLGVLFKEVHQLHFLHRRCKRQALSSGHEICQWRIYSNTPDSYTWNG